MSEQIRLQRPSNLVEQGANCIATASDTALNTVDSVMEDSKTLLNAVLQHPSSKRELDHREKLFVSHYILSKNARRSALDAGYSDSTASARAYRWVRCDPAINPKLHVFAAIHSHSEKIHNKAVRQAAAKLSTEVINNEWVLNKSVEHVRKSSGDIPTHITRTIDPVTKAERIVEHYDYDGGQVAKGIELVGKNKKIKSFSNELEVSADSSLAQLLTNLAPQSTLPSMAVDISDAEIVEPLPQRPLSLPE